MGGAEANGKGRGGKKKEVLAETRVMPDGSVRPVAAAVDESVSSDRAGPRSTGREEKQPTRNSKKEMEEEAARLEREARLMREAARAAAQVCVQGSC
eukprot:2011609-Rhodomonas_salina.2